jgi:hypothetical protein
MKLKSMALAAALTAIGSPAGAQGVVMVRDVSYDMALVMAQTAIEHCRSLGFKIGVSVVDRGGHVLATLRDHGAAHHTVELAHARPIPRASSARAPRISRSGCATIRSRQGLAPRAALWPRSAAFRSRSAMKPSAASV